MYTVQLNHHQTSKLKKYIKKHSSLESFEIDNEGNLLPGIGSFSYESFKISITEEGTPTGDPPSYFVRCKIESDDIEKLENFIKEILKDEDTNGIKVHTNGRYEFWDTRYTVAQSIDDVFLPQSTKDSVIQRIEKFIADRDRYVKFGRSYKTGFLFHGVPGSGKTSFIKSIALKYNKPIYSINFTKNLTDEKMIELVREIKPNSILLIEDVDSYFEGREAKDINCSFSALINILDGVLSNSNGTLIFMTANDKSKLDPALIRPGRIDCTVEFDYPKNQEILEAYVKFNGTTYGFENFVYDKVPMSAIIDSLFTGFDNTLKATKKRNDMYI